MTAHMHKQVQKKGAYPPLPVRTAMLLSGELDPSELDDEEVLRGQLRGSDGTFSGNRSDKIPRKLHEMMHRELVQRMTEGFAEMALEAVDTIRNVMHHGETRDIVRLNSAQFVVERIMGKVEQRSTVSGEVTIWQRALEGGELFVDVENPDIVEAEVVEEKPAARPKTRRRRSTSVTKPE